jgi:hypothetical protein
LASLRDTGILSLQGGTMTRSICRQCGTQYADSEAPPESCVICLDDRQFVRWTGQEWTALDLLRQFTGEGAGIAGIGIEPAFAIGQRALLLESQAGNVLWDCVSLVTDEAVAEIKRRGGLTAIAISHPHYYTSMLEWSAAFGDVPVYLHADDHRWVQRRGDAIIAWTGETMTLNAGMTLVRCGGHFPGGQVLHWQAAEGGKGALMTGDIVMVALDRRHVSFMYSYPNYIPLGAPAVRHIATMLAPYAYDSIYGAWTHQKIVSGAKAALAVSVERYLRAIRG